jgi:hypothetical protein
MPLQRSAGAMPLQAWRRRCLVSAAFAGILFASDAARAACDPAAASNVTATCTGATNNQGTGAPGSSGGVDGYGLVAGLSNVTVNVLTGASVTGTNSGIRFTSGTVNNSGSVSGQHGILAVTANVTNFGTISGTTGDGLNVTNLVLTNYGTITTTAGGWYGVAGNFSTNIANSGFISGVVNGILTARAGSVTNSGTIIGGSGTAIRFNSNGTPASDDLTVLPGARFGGLVDFGGGADRVNFGPGNWILNTANLNAARSTVSTSGGAYVVTPNQIIVTDLSGFGAANRAIMDITGWVSSVLPETPAHAPAQGGGTAFAATESAAPRFDAAFDNFPSALPYAPTPVFNGGVVNDRFGNSFWAKGFGGRREQGTTTSFTGNVTTGYGGAIGYDRHVTSNFLLGAFIGGGTNETKLDFNVERTDTDTLFGGVYARSQFGASFIDLALIGGRLDNDTKRNIGGGLALETALSSYSGWFVNPLITVGHSFLLGGGVTLTPAVKARYVATHFEGYTETGSTVNLTVAGRDVQIFEERAELTLASVQYWNANRITFRMTGGVLAQQRAGDAAVNAVLLGTNFVVATSDQKHVTGLYGNWGIDWQVGRIALFAAGEITGTNDNATSFAGKGGMRVAW